MDTKTVTRRVGTVTLLAAAALTTVLTGTASAHTPHLNAQCTDEGTKLTVRLESYHADKTNSVKVTDGDEVLVDTEFDTRFERNWTVSAEKAHTFVIEIKAGDDPTGEKKWTRTETREVAACVTAPPSSSATTEPSEEPTSEPPASEETVAPTTESTPASSAPASTSPAAAPRPAPPAAGDELADTGASLALPLALGGLLLAGGAGALVLVRRRARGEQG